MSISVFVSSFNMISFSLLYSTQINMYAITLMATPIWSLRRYMPDEPGTYDPKKNRPPHHSRKGVTKPPPTEKPNSPRGNYTYKVTSMVGSTVVLKCDIGINNATVIWLKHEHSASDNQTTRLAVNSSTELDDKRFLSCFDIDSKVWQLRIRYAQLKDKGWYECEICSSQTYSIFVHLKLVEASAHIIGGPVKEVIEAFPIRLSCMVNTTERPKYMFWYHDGRMINYDLKDGAVVREGRLGTELIFPRALSSHSGNYSCVPSNARQASVLLVVFRNQGERVTNSRYNSRGSKSPSGQLSTIIFILIVTIVFNYSNYLRVIII